MKADFNSGIAILLESNPDARERLDWVQGRFPRCESPLEKWFIIVFAFKTPARNISYAGERPPEFAHEPAGKTVEVDISQQVDVAGYRVDFLFTIQSTLNRDLRRLVAVELDGHSFHDRTPAQASRDRARDRALLRHGVPTLRFTFEDFVKRPDESWWDLNCTLRVLAKELNCQESAE